MHKIALLLRAVAKSVAPRFNGKSVNHVCVGSGLILATLVPYNAQILESADLACQRAGLELFRQGLREREQIFRRIYVSDNFKNCIKQDLPRFKVSEGQASLASQLVAEVRGFCRGDGLAVTTDFHCLRPERDFVWQLKTADLRLFGWFVVPNWIVLHSIGDANDLHEDWDKYKPFVQEVVNFRSQLPPGLPGPVRGVKSSDVISNRAR